MKNDIHRIAPLLLPLLISAGLSSCVDPGYSGDGHYSVAGVYTTLPSNYAGSAYYYNGRYYSGGSYQTGRYNYQGRPYSSRYYYNGQYYYGGRYQQHAAAHSRQDPRREYDRSNYREGPGSQRSYDRPTDQSPDRYERTSRVRTGDNPYR